MTSPTLPPLDYGPWEAAKETLHLWCQIVGKTKLALTFTKVGAKRVASRKFRQFAPGGGSDAARVAISEWRRATRAALAWAREEGT